MDFGTKPLSHPLIVDAIETLFHPGLVYNNIESDKELLERFEEPSWNNPVMRFLNSEGEDVVPRRDRVWTTTKVVQRLVEVVMRAQEAAGGPIRAAPEWLRIAFEEQSLSPRSKATFAMHCFWVGEARFGAQRGVLKTRPAWYDGKEVVEVEFDPRRISYADLVSKARELECATKVYTHDDAQREHLEQLGEVAHAPREGELLPCQNSDHLHHLRSSHLRALPLTPLQALRVNASIEARDAQRIEARLSPRQVALVNGLAQLRREDPEQFETLVRPDEIEELDEYEDRLRKILGMD